MIGTPSEQAVAIGEALLGIHDDQEVAAFLVITSVCKQLTPEQAGRVLSVAQHRFVTEPLISRARDAEAQKFLAHLRSEGTAS